jgi:heptosyltransferase-2
VSRHQGKILVIRGGAIGDFILTLPAIAALRERFPHARLEVLGYPHIAQLALAGGLVDAVQPIEARALAGFFARGGALAEDLRDYFSECDIIVSYLYDPDAVFQDNVERCSVAQFIQGPHRPNEREKIHATKVYLKPLERLAIFEADPVPRLKVAPATSPASDGTFGFAPSTGGAGTRWLEARATLALHPGSGSERKNWPEAKWRDFIAHLVERTPLHLLIVGGEAEGDRLHRLAAPLPADRRTLARSLPLAELARLLQQCRSFVGHDSGITHLAAALGLPCVALWGDTVEEVWRPQGDKMVVVCEARGLGTLMVERVIRQLAELPQLGRAVAAG